MSAQLQGLFERKIARRSISRRLRHPQQNDIAPGVGSIGHCVAWNIPGRRRPWLDPWRRAGFKLGNNARRDFRIEVAFHEYPLVAEATKGGRVVTAVSGRSGRALQNSPPGVLGQAGGLARAETWVENM